MDPARLSLNQMTVRGVGIPELLAVCARHEVRSVGLWREPVSETGLRESARLIRESGTHVSSLCRGGFFGAPNAEDDNRRAVEEAAELGTDLLVLVCGGLSRRTLEEARDIVARGIASLAPFAQAHNVRLGIEPLHPMYTASRSVIVTIEQALSIAAAVGAPNVGLVLDIYHVWWDPQLYRQIELATKKIFGFHVCDWLDPLPDFVNGRGMMGDGSANIRRIREAVETAGFGGSVEVEIFNERLWAMPPDEIVSGVKERFRDFV